MKRVYLTGQRTFSNRGCEAIVRSTVSILRDIHEDLQILVPSDDIRRDSAQWPEAEENGVLFVRAYVPWLTRYWAHTQRLPLPVLKRAGWPFPFPHWLKEQLASVDAVLSIGGDNYSLDYRLPSLLQGIDALAMSFGKPVVVWGASVGPFEKEPHFTPSIKDHLSSMDKVYVRESISFDYLTHKIGLSNVTKMVDPAFILQPQETSTDSFWPEDQGAGVIGLNISPLIERYKRKGQNLIGEVSGFVRQVVNKQGFGVLLVPHVVPLDGVDKNNDAVYMAKILEECGDLGRRITTVPSTFNAAQLKHVIEKTRFFIGARTHATIAALSSSVPTVSISYSVKAKGINCDLFGDESMVLPTPELSSQELLNKLDLLIANEKLFREKLSNTMPEYYRIIKKAAGALEIKA